MSQHPSPEAFRLTSFGFSLPETVPGFDLAPVAPSVRFTYSHPGQSAFRRGLIRGVEALTGQPKLQRLYLDWALCDKRPGEAIFDAALRKLGIRSDLIGGRDHLEALPRCGGLLLVANHPFGVVDGLALGQLGLRLRGNVRIMTNSLLCRLPELDPHVLPVDFSGTVEARRITGETRRRAVELLSRGQCVAIFPAGGVATANRPVTGPALDAPWHPFVARLATLPGVTTLPLHFSGQNSRLFQLASHLSYPLRVALVFHETRRRMHQPVELTVGEPIPAQALAHLSREDVTMDLRRRVMRLASPALNDLDEVFHWPPHIRW